MSVRSLLLLVSSFGLLWSLTARLCTRFWTSDLAITFYDVGQGDGIGIQFPGGHTWLVDGGGGFRNFDEGRRAILPELLRKGVLHLESLVLTHPDQDHLKGLGGVLEGVGASAFWIHPFFLQHPTALLREVLFQLHQKNIRIHVPTTSEFLHPSGVGIGVFVPRGRPKGKANDRSLIVSLRYRGCTFLLTGDIEARSEKEALAWIPEKILVLKVAHHGSKTSSTEAFLRKVQPKMAVISVGGQNRYGHPHPLVLSRFRRLQIPVLRTDLHGAVEVRVSPDGSYRCQSFVGPCGSGYCSIPR